MRVVETLPKLAAPTALVPTMGALHAGHQSLIRLARQYCDEVVVSVFVNPLQFEDPEDLAKYPKSPERDVELAREAGATILWRPSPETIYPGNELRLSAGELGQNFEGVHRTGHFDGVLTVVNRLFELVNPKFAIFGEKDLQQLFLIKQMASELHPQIQIIPAPTIRELSGLALSSRNSRLTPTGRKTATLISQILSEAAACEDLAEMKAVLAKLNEANGFTLDYVEVIDEDTFKIATLDSTKLRAIAAGWIDGIRLIDNMAMQRKLVRV